MFIDTSYKDSVYPKPDHLIPVEDKGKDWHMAFCKYIYAQEINGTVGGFCDKRSIFPELRDYSNGEQNKDQYIDRFLQKSPDNEYQRKSYININFDILSIAPKFKKVALGITDEVTFDTSVDDVDDFASTERQNRKWDVWFEKEYGEKLKKFDEEVGIPEKKVDFKPRNRDELNLIYQMGGFRLNTEIAMETLLQHTDNVSDKEELARKIKEDIYIYNVGAAMDSVNHRTGQCEYERLDPYRLIVLGGKNHNDRRDATAYGYLEWMSLQQVAEEAELNEDEIRDLASKYESEYGNYQIEFLTNSDDKKFGLDDFMIPVLNCEFSSIDRQYKFKKKGRNGEVFSYPQKNQNVYDDEKRKTVVTNLQVWRKAKWVVGTEICWKHGLQYNIPRKSKAESKSSFHVYAFDGQSIQEQLNTLLDSIQNWWLRYQTIKQEGRYSGIAIEFSALKNISLGKEKLSPIELLRIYNQKGVLFYKSTTHRGHFVNNAGRPIDVIPSGIKDDIATVIIGMKHDLDLIREISGINEVVASSDPNPDVGLGASRIAMGSASNMLKYIVTGWQNIYKSVSENIMLRAQIIAKYGPDSYYREVLGDKNWEMIKTGADNNIQRYGLNLNVRPNKNEIAQMSADIARATAVGKNGRPVITISEKMALDQMLHAGVSMKLIRLFMASREAVRDQQDVTMQRENMQLNAKSAAESDQRKGAAKAQEIGMGGEQDRLTEKTKGDEDRKSIYTKGDVEMEVAGIKSEPEIVAP